MEQKEERQATYQNPPFPLLHLLQLLLILLKLLQQLHLPLLLLLARLEPIEVLQARGLLLVLLHQLLDLLLARGAVVLRAARDGDEPVLVGLLRLASGFAPARLLGLVEDGHVVVHGAEELVTRRVAEAVVGTVSLQAQRGQSVLDALAPDDLGAVPGGLASGFQACLHAGLIDEDDDGVRAALLQLAVPCGREPCVVQLVLQLICGDSFSLLAVGEAPLNDSGDVAFLGRYAFEVDPFNSTG